MKARTLKLKTLGISLALGAAFGVANAALAQVANISTTAASSFNSLNLTTTMQNASPTTAFSNDGATMLVIKSAATLTTATLITQATQMSQSGYGLTTLSNVPISVPANTYLLLGPFPQSRWNTPQGTVAVSFTSVTGISVTAVSEAQ